MNEYEFENLELQVGEYIMIHTLSGTTWDGVYYGNYDNSTLEFDFDNHNNGSVQRINITDLHSIMKK
ncbi:hypothetical protein [Algoriphagus sp.]|uniref:hypothetical protein n=1 Tax=Algoriphagus sp. TaxID=1872435 RepID=UPI003F6E9C61